MAKNDKKVTRKKFLARTVPGKKVLGKAAKPRVVQSNGPILAPAPLPVSLTTSAAVLDRLYAVVTSRKTADPAISHSARLLARGTEKVAQKFGEEAVECLIEAVAGNAAALVGESADVLYHLLVMWVDAGVRPEQVWQELERREGISGIMEKAGRAPPMPATAAMRSRKIP